MLRILNLFLLVVIIIKISINIAYFSWLNFNEQKKNYLKTYFRINLLQKKCNSYFLLIFLYKLDLILKKSNR